MKYIYIIIVLGVVLSCGGGSDDGFEPEPENMAPSTPMQVYPLNNTLCIDNNVVFEWVASTDPEQGALRYKLEIAENNTFSPLFINETITSTSRNVNLTKGKLFYWRVKAIDNKSAESAYSNVAQFQIEGEAIVNRAPLAPTLVLPTMNSEIPGFATTLSWKSSDPDNDSLTHDVYFDTVNPPLVKVSENQSATTFTTGFLTAATTYYFRVNVKDNKGVTTIGPVWSFKTK
ncbi:hypothetical protein [Flavobacterium faecale]|uniref:hypothetical protein n=1 Tax=Flavobacterium faecale TaxID=1355330 RepID=UPI003AB0D50F